MFKGDIMTKIYHELEPFFKPDSEILILGSLPSVKSRQEKFYYAHPQNRFWKILAKVYNEDIPKNTEEKQQFLLKYKIALWDVIKSCDITGSSDSSIKDVIPNDINMVLEKTHIRKIYTTGNKAYQLYNKHCLEKTNIKAIKLPSTSPAYCPKGIDDILFKEFCKITERS